MIKLYYHPLSTYARRVHMQLLEKGVEAEAEYEVVDMAAGVHREQPFLDLNPYHRVPVLRVDDFVLYESVPIMEYLEERFPEPALVPADPHQRALMRMHCTLCDGEMARPTGTIIFPKRFMPPERWRKEEMDKARTAVERHLQILDGQLGDRAFLLGDQYTLADICYTPFIHFLDLMEVVPPSRVAAWAKRLALRPTALQTKPSI